MAVDEKYQDNLVITKDAFQNLLTNIKNYPIIDIDYITETDTDELHGDKIWPNYTDGMPCIKITYGDDRSTKGNIIFAENQRILINKYKKILNQLRVWINQYQRLKNRWDKIYALNFKIYQEKEDQIARYKARFATTEVNKLAFLKAGWNLLQYNLLDLFDPEINDERNSLLRASTPEKFQYQEFLGPDNFDYKKILLPDYSNKTITHNLEYIILNEEQKTKIIDTLITFRDIQYGPEESPSYFFSDTERTVINSFINFIASYNYFSVLEAIGLAGYKYTSDQILIIKDNKIQINDSNRVASFEKVSETASFREGTDYYKQEYSDIYINIGNSAYNSSNTYYLLDTYSHYSPYTYTTSADFEAKRHLLYLKQQELLCYRRVDDLTASNFASQRNDLYIQSSNSETMEAAIRAVLPQIVDDIVWTEEDPNDINLNFDSIYKEFSTNIANIANTLKTVVGPRLQRIEQELAKYAKILDDTQFTITDISTTVTKNEETTYTSSPSQDEATIVNHLLDLNYDSVYEDNLPLGLLFKVEIVNQAIANCNQLIQDIAAGRKDQDGNDIENGDSENRILYGYKYVKVGSNINFEHNLMASASDVADSYSQDYPGMNYPEIDLTKNIPQRTGTFRIDINGHTYEIGIQGLVGGGEGDINLSTGGDIYLTPSDDDNPETTGTVYIEGNLDVSGITHLHNDLTIDGDIIPGENESYNLGSSDYKWENIYGVNGYFDNLIPSDSSDDGEDTNLGSEDSQWTNAYITNLGSPTTQVTNAYITNLGSSTTPVTNVYATVGRFDTINIWNGEDTNPKDYIDLSTYINNAVTYDEDHPLEITNTSDGIQNTIRSNTDGTTTLPSGVIQGNTNASIHTEGGIYAKNNIYGERVFNAVFNDYAECRTTINLTPGHVVIDQDDGSLACSSTRLQPGAQVISDTYGHLMGATDTATTPIAVAGRVLVYTYQSRENYHAGMAVCSAPDGTVDIMTREEIRDYPDCIVGIVSEIPQYEIWGSSNVKVDGRIWIKVR